MAKNYTAVLLGDLGHRRFVSFSDRVLREGARRSAESLTKLARAARITERALTANQGALAEINEAVAAQVTAAVVAAYEARLHQRNPQYDRRTNRMPEGAMLRALKEYTAFGDAFAVHFINQLGFDSAAKQWARLNYGAGSRGHPTKEVFPLLLAGATVGPPLVDKGDTRPAFTMPVGVFVDSGGKAIVNGYRGDGGALFPSKQSGIRSVDHISTEGIEAQNFFNRGLEVLAKILPVAYAEFLNKAVEEGFG